MRTQPPGNPQGHAKPRAGEAVEGWSARLGGRLRAALGKPSSLLGLVALALGLIALAGWATGVMEPAEILPGTVPVKVNGAILLVLLGAAVILLGEGHLLRLSRALALVALLVVSATALEYAIGRDLGIDQLLLSDIARPDAPYPGRMALPAVAMFGASGLAVLLRGRSWRGLYPTTPLAVAAGAVGGLAMLGYAYGASDLTSIGSPTRIAFPVAVGSVALAAGILAADQRHGMQVLADRGLAGQLARRIVAVVLLVTPVGSWLVLQLQQAGVLDERFGATLIVTSEVLLFGALGLWAAGGIERLERLRAAADRSLRDSQVLLNRTQKFTKTGGWAYEVASRTVTWTDEVYRIHEVTRDYDPNSAERDIQFYSPGDQPTIAEAFRRGVEEGRPYDLELRLVTAKGREIWVRTSGRPQFLDGRVVRLHGEIVDITERKRTNRERDRMAAAVQQSTNGFVIVDADFRIAYANPVYAAGVGLAAAELVGRTAAEVMSIGLDPTTVADIARSVTAGQPWFREVDHRNPDGTVSRSEVSISALREANGEISGWLGVMRDVTERERDRAALAASEARLRTALDTMVDAVVVASAVRDEVGRIVDFRVEYVNPAIGPISGVSAGDQIGHTLLELFPAHRTSGLFEAYVRVVETGVPCRIYDFHYVDPEAAGGPLDQYVDQYAAKMGDGYVLSVRDVTERHRVEAEMRRLSMAIEQSEDGILIADAQGRITYANVALAADLGVEPSELVGRAGPELADGILDATTIVQMVEIGRAGAPWLGEIKRRLPDGSAGHVQARITPRLAADGSVEDFVINVRDVTDLRRAETERARHDHDVTFAARRAALEERGRLSRELHDGLAQDLWLAKLKAGRLATTLGRRPEAALLVHQLVDALDSALADARAAMTTLRSTDDAPCLPLAELLREEIEDLSDRFGLPIELAYGPELPGLPALGQAQILRIVREALTNARRHANATLVTVSLEALEDSLSVTVRDDGTGFDASVVPASSPGLAGMRERAMLIGGSLTIDSRPSAGTRVTLRVPVGSAGGTGVEARP